MTSSNREVGAIDIEVSGERVTRIEDGRGTIVCVRQGSIWITQSGSPRDFFVDAGQSLRIDGEGLTLLSAVGGARRALVTLVPLQRSASPLAERSAGGIPRLCARLIRVIQSARSLRTTSGRSCADAVRIA